MNTQSNIQLHPLSVEEINVLINDLFLPYKFKGKTYELTNYDLLNFAYAILRKAQEK